MRWTGCCSSIAAPTGCRLSMRRGVLDRCSHPSDQRGRDPGMARSLDRAARRALLAIDGGRCRPWLHDGTRAGLKGFREAQAPDLGISIGAINAAIIAGNTEEDRVAHLRKFWERITEPSAQWLNLDIWPLDEWQPRMSAVAVPSGGSSATTTSQARASTSGERHSHLVF
jgi:hypothetical protein